MSKESVLRMVHVCPVCHTSYMPDNGEICNCPEYDDHPFQPQAKLQEAWHEGMIEND
jgi:hypothetical protein